MIDCATVTVLRESSWPATARHYDRWSAAARASDIRFARSWYTHELCCLWPGNPWITGGIPIKLGALPRERAVYELRVLRKIAKGNYDPLTIQRADPDGSRRLRLNRLRPSDFVPVPPPFIRRIP